MLPFHISSCQVTREITAIMKVDRILLVFLGLVGFCETIKAPSKFRGAGLRKPNKFKAGKSSGSQTSLISRSSKRTILKSPPKSTVALIKDWALGVTTTVSFSSLLGVIFDQITDALEKEPTTMAEVGGKFREISKLFKSLKTALSENDKKDDEKIGTNFVLTVTSLAANFMNASPYLMALGRWVFNCFRKKRGPPANNNNEATTNPTPE